MIVPPRLHFEDNTYRCQTGVKGQLNETREGLEIEVFQPLFEKNQQQGQLLKHFNLNTNSKKALFPQRFI